MSKPTFLLRIQSICPHIMPKARMDCPGFEQHQYNSFDCKYRNLDADEEVDLCEHPEAVVTPGTLIDFRILLK